MNFHISISLGNKSLNAFLALMILTLDKEIPKNVIQEIQALDNVYEAIGLDL